MGSVGIAILIAVLLYLGLLLLVGYVATRPPRSPLFLSPAALGVPMEDVTFTNSEGQTLRGWWVPAENPKAVAVLLHGYVMSRSENASVAAELCRWGISCLLFDFRACGKSDGTRTTIGWEERKDVFVAVELARQRHPDLPILLIGSSMGAAAAAFALGERDDLATCAILDSSYSSLVGATLGWWRWLGGRLLEVLLAPVAVVAIPIAGFNPFRADVARSLARANCPILLIHGTRDDLVRPEHAKRNLALGGPHVQLEWMEGVGHSEARWAEPERFYERIRAFLADVGVLSQQD